MTSYQIAGLKLVVKKLEGYSENWIGENFEKKHAYSLIELCDLIEEIFITELF